jgi:hypothetical protein
LIATPSFTERFSTLAGGYDVVLSDVWGVIHNGIAATTAACDALIRFRGQGGTVVLITNAPRPGEVVTWFLDKVGVPRNAYDGIVSAGDVTRAVMTERPDKAVFHIGPSCLSRRPTMWSAPACATTRSRLRNPIAPSLASCAAAACSCCAATRTLWSSAASG